MVITNFILLGKPICGGLGTRRRVYFTLAMALKCYPLQPGGLLAVEAIAIGMTNAEHVKAEIMANFEVVLLLIFRWPVFTL